MPLERMDFVADALADSCRFRALTIVDHYTRESVAIEIGKPMTSWHVVEVLRRFDLVSFPVKREQRGSPDFGQLAKVAPISSG